MKLMKSSVLVFKIVLFGFFILSCSEQTGTPVTGFAIGPIVGATVDIYHTSTLTGQPLCTIRTENNSDLNLAGALRIPRECIFQEGFYLLVASGGMDIDSNDDGILDSTPSPMRGKLHAILTREELLANSGKLTAVTELAYKHLHYALAAGYGHDDIAEGLNQVAKALLESDLNSDGTIDRKDLPLWHPRLNAATFRPGLSRLNEVSGMILNGEDTSNATYGFFSGEPTLGMKGTIPDILSEDCLTECFFPGIETLCSPCWIRVEGDIVTMNGTNYRMAETDNGQLVMNPANDITVRSLDYFDFYFSSAPVSTEGVRYDAVINTNQVMELNVVNAETQQVVKKIPMPNYTSVYLAISGNRLLVLKNRTANNTTTPPPDLEFYDISSPLSPVLIGTESFDSSAWIVKYHLQNNALAVSVSNSDLGDSIQVFDFSGNSINRKKYALKQHKKKENQDTYPSFSISDSLIAVVYPVLFAYDWEPNTLIVIQRSTGKIREINMEDSIKELTLKGNQIFAIMPEIGIRIVDIEWGFDADTISIYEANLGGELSTSPSGNTLWINSSERSMVVSSAGDDITVDPGPSTPGSDMEITSDVQVVSCNIYPSQETLTAEGWQYSSFKPNGNSIEDPVCSSLYGNNEYLYIVGVESKPANDGLGTFTAANSVLSVYSKAANDFSVPISQISLQTTMQFHSGILWNGYLYLYSPECTYLVKVDPPQVLQDMGCVPSLNTKINDIEEIDATHAYIVDENGITLLNLSNPQLPSSEYVYPAAGYVKIASHNGYLYAAGGINGLHVLRIEDDGTLTPVSRAGLGMAVTDVKIWKNMVWVTGMFKTSSLLPFVQSVP